MTLLSLYYVYTSEERKFSDDEKLLAEYSGLWPKIKLIFNLFQSGNVSAQLDKTIKSSTKIYGKPVARAMMPLKLYVDLEVPCSLMYCTTNVLFSTQFVYHLIRIH